MAKKQITREMILNAAFELTRKEGVGALSVRSIARACGCSTQPIYLSFKGIDEIKDEVYKTSLEFFYNFLLNEIAHRDYPEEYKAMGMGYIKFARQEREVFRLLFMEKPRLKPGSVENSFEKSVEIIQKNMKISEADARKLHTEMWIFGHGIATMYITDYLDFDLNTVSDMYHNVFVGLTKYLGVKNDN